MNFRCINDYIVFFSIMMVVRNNSQRESEKINFECYASLDNHSELYNRDSSCAYNVAANSVLKLKFFSMFNLFLHFGQLFARHFTAVCTLFRVVFVQLFFLMCFVTHAVKWRRRIISSWFFWASVEIVLITCRQAVIPGILEKLKKNDHKAKRINFN